jgi:hypothetical protein
LNKGKTFTAKQIKSSFGIAHPASTIRNLREQGYCVYSNPAVVNGTEVVKYDIEKGATETVKLVDYKELGCIDLRGGSQIIPFGDEYRFCLNHETFLFQSEQNRKDGIYKHRFTVWDKDWNIIKVSPQFSFLNAEIEFAVGMCEYGDDYLMTFGFQDNAAYLLRVSQKFVQDFIFNEQLS